MVSNPVSCRALQQIELLPLLGYLVASLWFTLLFNDARLSRLGGAPVRTGFGDVRVLRIGGR